MTIAMILEKRSGETYCCHGNDPVSKALEMLSEKRIGALPVIDGARVTGIFSERDVIYGLQNHGAAFLDHPVSEAMTADVITVDPDTTVLSALSLMTQRRIRHLPVVKDGALTGFVSIGDLVKYRIDKIESEAAAMRDYIQMV